jgi:hypothetical protein
MHGTDARWLLGLFPCKQNHFKKREAEIGADRRISVPQNPTALLQLLLQGFTDVTR